MTRIAGPGVWAISIIGSSLLAKTLVRTRANKSLLVLIFPHIRVFAKRANRCLLVLRLISWLTRSSMLVVLILLRRKAEK